MTQHHHTRVIELQWFDGDLPEIKTDREREALYQTLGRLMYYGMFNDSGATEDSITLMTITPRKNEIMLCKYGAVFPFSKYEDGSTKYYGGIKDRYNEVHKELRGEKRPFVMGAVLRENAEWTFHS